MAETANAKAKMWTGSTHDPARVRAFFVHPQWKNGVAWDGDC
jgi:hypothetical protein